LDAQTTGKVMTGHKNYEYLNLEYIFEMADGDSTFVKEIIETFLEVTPKNMNLMADAVAARNATDMIFHAHKLKGSFNFIGSTQLSDTFTQIESFATATDKHKEIEVMMTAIIATAASILADLKELDATLPTT